MDNVQFMVFVWFCSQAVSGTDVIDFVVLALIISVLIAVEVWTGGVLGCG